MPATKQRTRPETDRDDSYIGPEFEDCDPHAPDPEDERRAGLFGRVQAPDQRRSRLRPAQRLGSHHRGRPPSGMRGGIALLGAALMERKSNSRAPENVPN